MVDAECTPMCGMILERRIDSISWIWIRQLLLRPCDHFFWSILSCLWLHGVYWKDMRGRFRRMLVVLRWLCTNGVNARRRCTRLPPWTGSDRAWCARSCSHGSSGHDKGDQPCARLWTTKTINIRPRIARYRITNPRCPWRTGSESSKTLKSSY